MINIASKNKADVKDSYDKLFNHISTNNRSNAIKETDLLERNIKKYNISRGQNSNGVDNVFFNIKYALRHYTRNDWRQQELYRLMEQLSKQLYESEKNISLKERISTIYSDIREDFKTVCITGKPRDMDSLIDDFIELEKLSIDVAKQGSDVYKSYTIMMQNAGKCQATLPRLMPQENPIGRWVTKPETINALSASFEMLYSSLNGLLAALDEPVEEKPIYKKLSEGTLRDLEEDKIKSIKNDSIKLLKEKWPINEIARQHNMTVDEIIDILGLEE